MTDCASGQPINAMAFYHEKGFVPAYQQASQFAGDQGRVATLPDIIAARIGTRPTSLQGYNPSALTPWDSYFTTLTSEFLGVTRGGVKALIVAHGVGPMAGSESIVEAYRYQFADRKRNRRGGRISKLAFYGLETGRYGEVSVIDFESYMRRREYPFYTPLLLDEALEDPLVLARLGPRAEEYLAIHAEYASQFTMEEEGYATKNPRIIQMSDESNCSYMHADLDDGPIAHLISIAQIAHLSNHHRPPNTLWHCDVSCHGWSDGTRFVGIRTPGEIESIHSGPDARKLVRTRWQELLVPTGMGSLDGFFVLVRLPDGTWFTQRPKMGEGLDTGEPWLRVVNIEEVGKPLLFETRTRGYYGFFKYAVKEVEAIMPQGANAYCLTSDPGVSGDGERQWCMVQPYRVEVDATMRLTQADELSNDLPRMLDLLSVS